MCEATGESRDEQEMFTRRWAGGPDMKPKQRTDPIKEKRTVAKVDWSLTPEQGRPISFSNA